MVRRTLLLALVALGVAACSTGQAAAPPTDARSPAPSTDASAPDTEPDVSDPAEPDDNEAQTTEPEGSTPSTTTRRTTTTASRLTAAQRSALPIGDLVDGNRLLMIGDSILASTAPRYDGEMCEALVPLGWAVEIDAETGREIEFGNQVLDRRLAAGWDAAVVFLGNNYPTPPEYFAAELRRIVERLQPRPTVLVTVSEHEPRQAEVNYVVRTLAEEFDDVRVVEWAVLTGQDDDLTRADDLHPTDAGRSALASVIADVVGPAPGDQSWRPTCLPTEFVDDLN